MTPEWLEQRALALLSKVWALPEPQRTEHFEAATRDPQLQATLRRYLASATRCIEADQPTIDGQARTTLLPQSPAAIAEAYPAQLGTYRVVRRIGAGGMGEVLEAYDERLHRRVALKMIRAEALASHPLGRIDLE